MVRLNHSVNDIDDINNKNVFINHSVKILARNMNTNTTKPLEKELVNDKNDKNVFVSPSVNDIDDIDDVNDLVNDVNQHEYKVVLVILTYILQLFVT